MQDFDEIINQEYNQKRLQDFFDLTIPFPNQDPIDDPNHLSLSVNLEDDGVSLVFFEQDSKPILKTIILMGNSYRDNASGYKGIMPFDLSFNDNESAVINKLGEPINTGGGVLRPNAEYVRKWANYSKVEKYNINIQYSEAGISRLIITP